MTPIRERDSGVPDLILEQYRLNELPRAERDRVSGLLSTDAALRARHEALDRSDEEVARNYPGGWLATRIRARLDSPPAVAPTRWRGRLALAAAAAALILAVPVWRASTREAAAPAPSEDRIKGLSPALSIYRRTAEGSETLADGSIARPGDLLRLGYRGAGRAYGVILSIDGRGVVTLHLPPHGDRAAPLTKGQATLLDQAYELDDAPGWERFYFITGETAFAVAPVVEAAKKAAAGAPRGGPAALPLGRELTQSTFSLQKEARP